MPNSKTAGEMVHDFSRDVSYLTLFQRIEVVKLLHAYGEEVKKICVGVIGEDCWEEGDIISAIQCVKLP